MQNRSSQRASKVVGPVAPLAVAPLFPGSSKEEGHKLLTTASGKRVPIQPSVSMIAG